MSQMGRECVWLLAPNGQRPGMLLNVFRRLQRYPVLTHLALALSVFPSQSARDTTRTDILLAGITSRLKTPSALLTARSQEPKFASLVHPPFAVHNPLHGPLASHTRLQQAHAPLCFTARVGPSSALRSPASPLPGCLDISCSPLTSTSDTSSSPVRRRLKRLTAEFPSDPASLLLGIYTEELGARTQMDYLHTHVHGYTTGNGQKAAATQMSINR